MQASIKEHVYKTDKVATAATIVEPGTGKILGMGQSRPYGFGKNETADQPTRSTTTWAADAGYQPGSTFKPYRRRGRLEQGQSGDAGRTRRRTEMQYPSPVQTCDGKPWSDNGVRERRERERVRGRPVRA